MDASDASAGRQIRRNVGYSEQQDAQVAAVLSDPSNRCVLSQCRPHEHGLMKLFLTPALMKNGMTQAAASAAAELAMLVFFSPENSVITAELLAVELTDIQGASITGEAGFQATI